MTGDPAALRAVTDDEIETFWRDGVVCLRQILPVEVVAAMADPIEELLDDSSMADLSAMADALEQAGANALVDAKAPSTRGRFVAGTDHWVEHDAFRRFAVESPIPSIVAQVLRSRSVWLYEDSVLVKEPGTRERTGFHQDMAYFHLDGENVCTTWVPLDTVDASTGAVRFVVGSHLDDTQWRPNMFVADMQIPGTEGADVPDFDQVSGATVISFDTVPGDLTIHHARTIHGAGANTSADRRRRAISVRYAGDGVVFRRRAGVPDKPHHAELVDGEALTPPAFPVGRIA